MPKLPPELVAPAVPVKLPPNPPFEPPPPPNQIVYVKSSAPFALTSLFEGVMITGTMRVQSERKNLSFVDGSSEIALGYVLENGSIEPYQYE